MTRKIKMTRHTAATQRKADVLGRSALTGTRVLRPASKAGAVSLRQVRSALRTLSTSPAK